MITLSNPKNQIKTPIRYEQSVTTRPGEIVVYYYSNETYARMRIKGKYDLTQIRDVIQVDVLFKSGKTKTVYLQVGHNDDGVLIMRASDRI